MSSWVQTPTKLFTLEERYESLESVSSWVQTSTKLFALEERYESLESVSSWVQNLDVAVCPWERYESLESVSSWVQTSTKLFALEKDWILGISVLLSSNPRRSCLPLKKDMNHWNQSPPEFKPRRSCLPLKKYMNHWNRCPTEFKNLDEAVCPWRKIWILGITVLLSSNPRLSYLALRKIWILGISVLLSSNPDGAVCPWERLNPWNQCPLEFKSSTKLFALEKDMNHWNQCPSEFKSSTKLFALEKDWMLGIGVLLSLNLDEAVCLEKDMNPWNQCPPEFKSWTKLFVSLNANYSWERLESVSSLFSSG